MEIKKIAYDVLVSSKKLKHYFQAHEITVHSLQGQVIKEYVAREPELAQYLARVKALEWRF
jgi:ABC-type xylose transport system substrate-binding protein